MARDTEVTSKKAPEKLPERELGYSRTATRLKIARSIWLLWEQFRDEENVDQQWLADRLGKHKGQVSKLLKGPGNWTLDTVADLLGAMEAKVTIVEVKRFKDIAAESSVPPSFQGLREKPRLWNVITINVEDNGNAALELPSRTSLGVKLVKRTSVVLREDS